MIKHQYIMRSDEPAISMPIQIIDEFLFRNYTQRRLQTLILSKYVWFGVPLWLQHCTVAVYTLISHICHVYPATLNIQCLNPVRD